MYDDLENRLSNALIKYNKRSDTNQIQWAMACPREGWQWEWYDAEVPSPYFIASTTKLYIAAILMQLRAEGSVALDEPVVSYLPAGTMEGIHVLDGQDSSMHITTRHLLSQTSGVADYFEEKGQSGKGQFEKALVQDFEWGFEEVLRITKNELKPHFSPGLRGKAHYSDTNYQLLGTLIETISNKPLKEVIKERITQPLGLRDTYLFSSTDIPQYDGILSMLYGTQKIRIPRAMSSVGADGGIVSTALDGILFLKSFMNGELFSSAYIKEMQQEWNPIFSPFEYGMGLMRFKLPRIYSPFDPIPPMIGHSGASGTVLFYVPACDLYISGTINQIKKRALSFRLLVKLVMMFKKRKTTR